MAKGNFDRDVNRSRIAKLLQVAKNRATNGSLTGLERAAVEEALENLTVDLADFYIRISPKFERQEFYKMAKAATEPPSKGRRKA